MFHIGDWNQTIGEMYSDQNPETTSDLPFGNRTGVGTHGSYFSPLTMKALLQNILTL